MLKVVTALCGNGHELDSATYEFAELSDVAAARKLAGRLVSRMIRDERDTTCRICGSPSVVYEWREADIVPGAESPYGWGGMG